MTKKIESILITGGTGSLGQALVAKILERFPKIQRLVIFSRDELKQYEMAQKFSHQDYPAMRYFIGDVRDRSRLKRALEGIDTVIHAAALKHVPAAEYNPMEFIHTNVLGAENLIEACMDTGVKSAGWLRYQPIKRPLPSTFTGPPNSAVTSSSLPPTTIAGGIYPYRSFGMAMLWVQGVRSSHSSSDKPRRVFCPLPIPR